MIQSLLASSPTTQELLEDFMKVSSAWNGTGKMTTGEAINKLRPITLQDESPVLARKAGELLERIIVGVLPSEVKTALRR